MPAFSRTGAFNGRRSGVRLAPRGADATSTHEHGGPGASAAKNFFENARETHRTARFVIFGKARENNGASNGAPRH